MDNHISNKEISHKIEQTEFGISDAQWSELQDRNKQFKNEGNSLEQHG